MDAINWTSAGAQDNHDRVSDSPSNDNKCLGELNYHIEVQCIVQSVLLWYFAPTSLNRIYSMMVVCLMYNRVTCAALETYVQVALMDNLFLCLNTLMTLSLFLTTNETKVAIAWSP